MTNVAIKIFNTCSAAFLVVLLVACASTNKPGEGLFDIKIAAAGLGDLTIQLHEDMLLRKQMKRFAAIASEDFIIMIPGGMLETKQEDIDGAKNFNVESVKFSNVTTRTHGRTAVVTGRWSLVGRLGKLEMTGDYEFMSVYEYMEGRRALVAEAITRRRSLAAALAG